MGSDIVVVVLLVIMDRTDSNHEMANALRNMLAKGRLENAVVDQAYLRQIAKMADKLVKFNWTDPNCHHKQMKTHVGPHHHSYLSWIAYCILHFTLMYVTIRCWERAVV